MVEKEKMPAPPTMFMIEPKTSTAVRPVRSVKRPSRQEAAKIYETEPSYKEPPYDFTESESR